MSRIWKDKIFLACLFLAFLAGVGLIITLIKNINFNLSLSSSTPPENKSLHSSSPSPIPQVASRSIHTRSGFLDKLPVVKVRPKSGKNEWRVGSGEEFDSNDLNTVINNAVSGDLVYISPGNYEFSINKAFKRVHIIGEEGVILDVNTNSSYIPTSDSLVLEKIQLKFVELAASSYLYLQKNINLTLKQTKIEGTNFYFSLNDSSKIEAIDSQFVGVSFRVNESSKLELNNCYLEKADTFISMSGFSTVKIDKTHFTRFSDSAIFNRSQHTSLKAYDIKVDNGRFAFSGYNMSSLDVSHSSFSKLDTLASDKIKINCVMCEFSDIQR